MSQINSDGIFRRLAELTQIAWPDVAGKIAIGRPQVGLTGPIAAVVCERVDRDGPGFVRKNAWSYTISIYGRFPYPESGSVQSAKDARLNDLYDEIQPSDGKLRTESGDILLEMVRCNSFDLTDYLEDDKVQAYDVAMTLAGVVFADVT